MFVIADFDSRRLAFDSKYRAIHCFHGLPMSRLCRDRLSIPLAIPQIENLGKYFPDLAILFGWDLHLAQ